jgi:hypothetical protein
MAALGQRVRKKDRRAAESAKVAGSPRFNGRSTTRPPTSACSSRGPDLRPPIDSLSVRARGAIKRIESGEEAVTVASRVFLLGVAVRFLLPVARALKDYGDCETFEEVEAIVGRLVGDPGRLKWGVKSLEKRRSPQRQPSVVMKSLLPDMVLALEETPPAFPARMGWCGSADTMRIDARAIAPIPTPSCGTSSDPTISKRYIDRHEATGRRRVGGGRRVSYREGHEDLETLEEVDVILDRLVGDPTKLGLFRDPYDWLDLSC